jgi:hypothetical protein
MGAAATKGDIEMIALLKEHGANINWQVSVSTGPLSSRSGTPLRLAEEASQLEMIRWLKANGGTTESEPVTSTPRRPGATPPPSTPQNPPVPQVVISWDIGNNWTDDAANTAPFSNFCDKLLRHRTTRGIYAGVGIGEEVKSRDDQAYKDYLDSVLANCKQIARGAVSKAPGDAKIKGQSYDRYTFSATWSNTTLPTTVYVGVENDRCVAYWFTNGTFEIYNAAIGNATMEQGVRPAVQRPAAQPPAKPTSPTPPARGRR